MKKTRILVCGTSFGQFYIEAIKRIPDQFELAGVFARGSERSSGCCRYYGLPLFTSLEELPENIDLACVVLRSGVLGGKGTELSLQLLERKINVLQEQPVHQKDLAECVRAAGRNKVNFFVGNLYMHLPAVRCFTGCAREIALRQTPLYLDAAFASQVSYPFVKMLVEALPETRPFSVKNVYRDSDPFHLAVGTVAGCQFVFRVHNEVDPEDPDNHLHLLQRILLGVDGGNLNLADTHGPVIWNQKLHVPVNSSVLGELKRQFPDYLTENTGEILDRYRVKNYREILLHDWIDAIAADLVMAKREIDSQQRKLARIQREILCAELWHTLTSAIGYPEIKSNCSHEYLPLREIKAAASRSLDNRVIDETAARKKTELGLCTEYADEIIPALKKYEVDRFVARLEDVIYKSMLTLMQKNGVFTREKESYPSGEIMQALQVQAEHVHLIERWLTALAEKKYLVKTDTGYSGAAAVSETELDALWKEVRLSWNRQFGSPLTMEYLLENVNQLPDLITGRQKAAYILFPQGKFDYANSLYKETIIARYLNRLIGEAVMRIINQAAGRDENRPQVKILEVGAGTGATTDVVISRLVNSGYLVDIQYLFSDISSFFFNDARQRYSGLKQMEYAVIDVDKDFSSQGMGDETADIVIAAGVLNNCVDTLGTINRLMKVLKKEGYLLISEPTREFAEILISQGFMMTKPVDERKEARSTFLTKNQWTNIFTQAGAGQIISLPGEEHPLASFGQNLFIVKKRGR